MTLSNEEVRYLAIDLLTKPTERDKQVRVGASDLANECDRCLAAKLAGVEHRSAITDQYWLGRVMGSAMSLYAEDRAKTEPKLLPEEHVWFGNIPGYGQVGGSIDLYVVKERHIIDWKGSLRWKIALLEDLLRDWGQHRVDQEPRFQLQKRGNYKFQVDSRTAVTLSASEYESEKKKMSYKMQGYYNQLTLYCHSGVADAASIVMFARDGNGMYDNPGLERYLDPKAKHDVFVWTFDYSREHAQGLLDRAATIVADLRSGVSVEAFASHEECFTCAMLQREAETSEALDYQPGVGLIAA